MAGFGDLGRAFPPPPRLPPTSQMGLGYRPRFYTLTLKPIHNQLHIPDSSVRYHQVKQSHRRKPMFRRLSKLCTVSLLLFVILLGLNRRSQAESEAFSNTHPILFITQTPTPADFIAVASVFGNHDPSLRKTPRGGDLWIRYPDGTLKNLTETAGYGTSGFQGNNSIAVRDPQVHWDGNKAIFSMVIGATEQQYVYEDYYWQIYEITGLGLNDTPVITKVPNQPPDYNNISPTYASDDQIIFTSDRPRNGARHLYPQLDEYEVTPIVSGIWKLNPANGDLQLLNHAPSGDFTPFVDSFGRVIFTQWDHLQRDQLVDTSSPSNCNDGRDFGMFNYSDETAGAAILNDVTEVYPDPRNCRNDLLDGTPFHGLNFNHFFPWQMNQDGTELETLNHIGRQELHGYVAFGRDDDPNIIEFYGQYSRDNPNSMHSMLQIKEFPNAPGTYIGTNGPEFHTHASGQIVSINGAVGTQADDMLVTYHTHPDTQDYTYTPSTDHSGFYRDPLPLSDGTIIVAHTAETRVEENDGTTANPISRYDFRLKPLVSASNGYQEGGNPLTGGINKTVSYYNPDVLVSFSGDMWELQPVEVRPRTRPPAPTTPLPAPEQTVFNQAGVSVSDLKAYMEANDLSLIVSRNVTVRDDLDLQQPFNLRIDGTSTQSIGASGTVYDVKFMQFFQADQLRGRGWYGGSDQPSDGRRVLAQHMHDPSTMAANIITSGAPQSSVLLGDDGSMAAFVPARRAMTWQMTDSAGEGVVKERYWLTFQPGEVRVCASCHGLSGESQVDSGEPQNPPQALADLLDHWQTNICSQDPLPNGCPVPTAITGDSLTTTSGLSTHNLIGLTTLLICLTFLATLTLFVKAKRH